MREEIEFINSIYINELSSELKASFHEDFLSIYPWEVELSRQEIDLLFGMIGLLNNNYDKWLGIDYGVIKVLGDKNLDENPKRVEGFVNRLIDKLKGVKVSSESNSPLFSIRNNRDEKIVMIKVGSEKYNYLFNDLTPDNSTTINLSALREFNTANGMKIYILLSGYRGKGDVVITMKSLRDKINTIRTSEYTDKIFTSRVILPMINDLLECRDLKFKYEFINDLNNRLVEIIFNVEGEITSNSSDDIDNITYNLPVTPTSSTVNINININ